MCVSLKGSQKVNTVQYLHFSVFCLKMIEHLRYLADARKKRRKSVINITLHIITIELEKTLRTRMRKNKERIGFLPRF